ncbi:hypothetical protein QCB44_03370 [Thiomicrorhabdus sp. zzn3]|uniref:ABC transporter substrate-binding protein n=1 Tax=Thiomicrorhabdus sp. zzn3 TaxID=3039775 RepID=UPI002436D7A5|nr:hypothetical protein [Thiomicrorhabdus sp. zzn3]MDG6777741.1 hypothetical protein [Thiomicrorhabdus sp. zzn3]
MKQTGKKRPLLHYALFFFLVASLFSACSSKQSERLEIMTNSWIGFSPLFYAKEQGWLDPLNIKLSNVVSLGENVHIYQTAQKHAFTGTQYEFQRVLKSQPDLVPIIMFDRSNGGDMVMSNRSIAELQATTETIDVYLELDTVNHLVFKDFVKQNNLNSRQFNFINKDQVKIVSSIEEDHSDKPAIIVTYIPYNYELQKKGFNVITSTADNLNLLVVDALYTPKDVLLKHRAQFKGLKKAIDDAVKVLKTDPKKYYQTVKPYLENGSYEDFEASLNDILWLNEELSEPLINRLNEAQFPIRDLL